MNFFFVTKKKYKNGNTTVIFVLHKFINLIKNFTLKENLRRMQTFAARFDTIKDIEILSYYFQSV